MVGRRGGVKRGERDLFFCFVCLITFKGFCYDSKLHERLPCPPFPFLDFPQFPRKERIRLKLTWFVT